MYRFLLSLALTASLPLLSDRSAIADTVELSGGGHLTGQVQRKANLVIVKIDDELQIAVDASRVRRVVTSDQLKPYREMAAKAGDDAENQYRLAIWCVTADNVPGDSQHYKRHHLRRAIELNPEHIKARAALGYTRHEGKWILTRQLMRDRGMIFSAGNGWELPEAVAIEDSQDATDTESKKWIREVKVLVAMVLRNSSKAPEAIQQLQAIRDPLAATAIAGQLEESRGKRSQSRALRMTWIKLLGQFRNSISVEALVKAGVAEDDEVIREAALDQLLEYGASSAVATYLPYLKKNDNKLLNRAARALTWFPDPELALTYVEALVTTHKTEFAPGPGMQVGFGDGGGGLQMGGKKQVQVETLRNPAVLTLLKSVEPDVDFGYDEKAWQNYFANKRTSFSGDLRRDL